MRNEVRLRAGGVAEIVLTQGKVALVDAADLPLLAEYQWYANRLGGKGWYAVGNNGPEKVLMHKVLVEAGDGMEIDHASRDGLDNRRRNLRVCTRAENAANSSKREGGTSGYKGVYWHHGAGKWVAQVSPSGKTIYLGLYEDEEDAARAYDAAALEHYGDFACPNFAPVYA